MLKEEHNKLLYDYLEESKNFPSKEGVRLYVAGSPLDNLQFYELVESCRAIIVGEDNCWGSRYAEDPIKTLPDPMEAVADRYQGKMVCTWAFPMNLRREYILQNVMKSKAQGVIIFINDGDYAGAWDAPLLKQGLEEKGLPVITCSHQPYLYTDTVRGALKTCLLDFIEALRANIT
jgi:benzoyl-CoA reductase/2-hydroxyglutaryl-CoA dehydratase subunit BcrC/BadD/HgdB